MVFGAAVRFILWPPNGLETSSHGPNRRPEGRRGVSGEGKAHVRDAMTIEEEIDGTERTYTRTIKIGSGGPTYIHSLGDESIEDIFCS